VINRFKLSVALRGGQGKGECEEGMYFHPDSTCNAFTAAATSARYTKTGK